MADDQDQSQKTEEPTHKKLEDARKKGEAPASREVNNWIMLIAGTIVVVAFAPAIANEMALALRPFVATPHLFVLSAGDAPAGVAGISALLAGLLAAPIAILVLAALGTGLVQRGFMASAESIRPKLDRISVISGTKRLFSMQALVEFLKANAKLVIVSAVAFMVMWSDRHILTEMLAMPPGDLLAAFHTLVTHLLIAVCSIVTLIAGLDFLFQRFQFMKKMRMSRQEIKDEMKQTEGDPHVRARLRQLRAERARQRMMANVPKADVVITNPTHYAVALQYDMDAMDAPKLVAKGVDSVAERIKAMAREHDIAVVENPPLARALFAAVDLEEEVPVEHYKAVAEVIGFVWRLKGKMPHPGRRR